MKPLIRQMGYVVVATPDPQGSARDLSDIVGLRIASEKAGAVYLTSNAKACEVAFVKGDRPGIRAVGLEAIDESAVDEILARSKADNLEILSDVPLVDCAKRAVRIRTPFGPILEVHTAVERQQHRGPNLLSHGHHVRRLDHVNLRANDPRAFYDFMTSFMGMKLSDRTTNFERAWYRAEDGFHHTIAAAPGEGIHHYGFDAYGVVDLASVADNLVVRGRELLWGVGRHGPGNNIFSYYLDPNGVVVEVSYGMERIDNDDVYVPGNWAFDSKSNVLDLWGSKPPEQYGRALSAFVI
jgi:catechol 2,3-dioxygenase-like lactoylglutathione lyase family enzyme